MTALTAPSALGTDSPIDVVLLAALGTSASGAVVAKDGKKKWVFVFDEGMLVETRSNLKSEHPDTVRAKKPSMSDKAVLRNCAMLRMRNATKGSAQWSWTDGTQAKNPTPVAAVGLLFRVVSGHRSAEELRARIDVADTATLVVAEDLAALELPRSVAAAPAGWSDGTVVDALSSGPGTEAERATALWFGVSFGCITTSESEDGEATAAEDSPPASENTLDIGALLDGLGSTSPASEAPAAATASDAPVEAAVSGGDAPSEGAGATSGQNWVPDKVLLPPEGTPSASDAPAEKPAGYEEAEIEAIGEDGPVKLDASFFEALNKRPDRELVRAQGFVHSSHDTPQGPPKHPMEDALRGLAERLETAPDFFSVLDVAWDADTEAFRRAHRDLAQKLHPDRFSDASEELQELATETFDKVRAAWETLSDDEKRQAYIDKVIHGKKTEDELAMEQVENYWAAEADFKRGLAAFHAGRVREAHELFKSAVSREENEIEFRAYLGFTTFQLHKTTDPDQAELGKEMLKDVLERNKEQERKLDAAWVLMGRIFRDQANDKGARKCFRQALKLNPANGDAQREMRRLTGGGPGRKKVEEAKKSTGFFSRWFGKKDS